ncbi:hypothetical protein ABU550_004135 [Yersinia enterocolitica]
MTELTKEQIAKFIKDIESEGMCDITDSQVELALRKLLACEQVAEKSINTIRLINKFYERYPTRFECQQVINAIHVRRPNSVLICSEVYREEDDDEYYVFANGRI